MNELEHFLNTLQDMETKMKRVFEHTKISKKQLGKY